MELIVTGSENMAAFPVELFNFAETVTSLTKVDGV
jgi:hypothetical protein